MAMTLLDGSDEVEKQYNVFIQKSEHGDIFPHVSFVILKRE